jgi:hypothetical protein
VRILVACEESQAVTIELRKLGHEAYSCDIEPCSGGHPEWHIQEDVLPLLNGNCFFTTESGCYPHSIYGQWDMIIAFPPCTYLSNAGACRLYPKKGVLNEDRYKNGLAAKKFFMMFLNADCPRIAVENPVSSRVFDMPPHSQEIQPYQFGHPYSKKTRLWLKGLPILEPTKIVDEHIRWVSGGSKDADGKQRRTGNGCTHRDPKISAKTFSGIARAMAEQWAGKA